MNMHLQSHEATDRMMVETHACTEILTRRIPDEVMR